MAQHSRGPSDHDQGQATLSESKQGMGSNRNGKLSATEQKRLAAARLSDLQVLQGIDSTDDPMGKHAMRQIDFTRSGISCGRKEFLSKDEALKALEQSKSRVTEIMQQARSMHLNKFKGSVGKTIKEDAILASMPRIRISAAKNHAMQSTIAGATKRNFFDNNNQKLPVSGLTPGNLSKISHADNASRITSAVPDHRGIGGGPLNLNNQTVSQEGSEHEGQAPKRERRQFATGINMATADKAQQSMLRNLTAIAPSAHHRFDKDSVHLRSMYRKLNEHYESASNSPLRCNINLIGGGKVVDRSRQQHSVLDNYNDSGRRSSLIGNREIAGTIPSSGFNTSFYQRRDTLSYYQPPLNATVSITLANKHINRSSPASRMQDRRPMMPWQQMRASSLLQNTPVVVDMHKSSFLQSKRQLKMITSPGTMMPTQKIAPVGEQLSRSQIMGLSTPAYNTTRPMQGSRFTPNQFSKHFLDMDEDKVISQRIENSRPKPKFVYKQVESSDEEEAEQFTANPAEDVPKNKLVDKLVRGLQHYIQRMQKRESFRLEIRIPFDSQWQPAPRECATLTSVGYNMYLMGGLNYDACREIICGKINGDQVIWERVPYTSTEPVLGRQCHTSCAFGGKIYTYGGCFMFSKKRQVRECTNQLLEFDTYERRLSQCKTTGFSAGARKNHCATVYKKSMVVYGGHTESGAFVTDMLVLHLEYMEWMKVQLKSGMAPFIQGACCSVISMKQKTSEQMQFQGKSDALQEGIYYFGGKNQKGELQNKLRYFKPVIIDGKVVHGEFTQIKIQGQPPVARFGHTMCYLPCNNAIAIAGGRNDSMSATNLTPFLNDIVLFLLDQKVWLNVKYSINSECIDYIGNHCMSVVSDNESYEKVLIFGGIQNVVGESIEDIKSSLSNKSFLVTINSRQASKNLFKEAKPRRGRASSQMLSQ